MWVYILILTLMIIIMVSTMVFLWKEKEIETETAKNNRKIVSFWTETNPMSSSRKECLKDMFRVLHTHEITLECLEVEAISKLERPEHPFHPAYPHLSAVHKSDYLRVYVLYFYGGGYADIKKFTHHWKDGFDYMDRHPDCWIVGYPEIGEHGIPKSVFSAVKKQWRSLVGVSAFIARPKTLLLKEWLDEVECRLTSLYEKLKAHPAQWPHDAWGKHKGAFSQMIFSAYPVPWSFLCADIFHTLQWKYLQHVHQGLVAPDFSFFGYR